jgi:hypothetical protein
MKDVSNSAVDCKKPRRGRVDYAGFCTSNRESVSENNAREKCVNSVRIGLLISYRCKENLEATKQLIEFRSKSESVK